MSEIVSINSELENTKIIKRVLDTGTTTIKPSIIYEDLTRRELLEAKMVLKRYLDFNCTSFYRPNDKVSKTALIAISKMLDMDDDLK